VGSYSAICLQQRFAIASPVGWVERINALEKTYQFDGRAKPNNINF